MAATTMQDLIFFGQGGIEILKNQINECPELLHPISDPALWLFEDLDLELFTDEILEPRTIFTDHAMNRESLKADLFANIDVIENVHRRLRLEYEHVRQLLGRKQPLVLLSTIQRHFYLLFFMLQLQWHALLGQAVAENQNKVAPEDRFLYGFSYPVARITGVIGDMRGLSKYSLDEWRDLVMAMVTDLNRGKIFSRGEAAQALEFWVALFSAFLKIIVAGSGGGPKKKINFPDSLANAQVLELSLGWGVPPSSIILPDDPIRGVDGMSIEMSRTAVDGDWTEAPDEKGDVFLGIAAAPWLFFVESGRRLRTLGLMLAEGFFFSYTPRLELLVHLDQAPTYKNMHQPALEDAISSLTTRWLQRRIQIQIGAAGTETDASNIPMDDLSLTSFINYLWGNLHAVHLFPTDVERYIVVAADASLRLRNKGARTNVTREIYENTMRPIINVHPPAQDVVYAQSWELFSLVAHVKGPKELSPLLNFICRDVIHNRQQESDEYRQYERLALLLLVTMFDLEAIGSGAKEYRLRDEPTALSSLWLDEFQHGSFTISPVPFRQITSVTRPFFLRIMRRHFLILPAQPTPRLMELPTMATGFLFYVTWSRTTLQGVPNEFIPLVKALRQEDSTMENLIQAAGGGQRNNNNSRGTRSERWF